MSHSLSNAIVSAGLALASLLAAAGCGGAQTRCTEAPPEETRRRATLEEATAGQPPPEVRDLPAAPRRRSPTGTAEIAILARGNEAFVGRLVMQPGATVPEHRDPTEEYIHILEGQGTITIEGTSYTVNAGTTVFMPAHALVTFQNGDQPLVAIQVFAGPEPAAKYDAWTELPTTSEGGEGEGG